MKKSQLVMKAARRVGAPKLLDLYWGRDRLTVLAHHRVTDDGTRPDFPYYQPNISAAPAQFVEQLAFIAANFNVISLDDLVEHVVGGKALPERPLLITFDDGYLDNYQHAYPALKQHGFPAVIFLMTSRMAHSVPAWWDECAYYFARTTLPAADLPLVRRQSLDSPAERLAAREAVLQQLKQVTEAQKLSALKQIGETLDVAPPPVDPNLFVNWDQVREMVRDGIACMPHTVTHPILTRVSPEQQREEIVGSRDRIREETGQDTPAFAYPNGGVEDYDRTTLQILEEEGFRVAFTLTPGPMRAARVHQYPLQIQRVFLSARDSLDRFVFKLMGVPAFQEPIRFID